MHIRVSRYLWGIFSHSPGGFPCRGHSRGVTLAFSREPCPSRKPVRLRPDDSPWCAKTGVRAVGGITYTLTYDRENRLTGVTGPSTTATFNCDASGNRVLATVNGVTTVYIGGFTSTRTRGRAPALAPAA